MFERFSGISAEEKAALFRKKLVDALHSFVDSDDPTLTDISIGSIVAEAGIGVSQDAPDENEVVSNENLVQENTENITAPVSAENIDVGEQTVQTSSEDAE